MHLQHLLRLLHQHRHHRPVTMIFSQKSTDSHDWGSDFNLDSMFAATEASGTGDNEEEEGSLDVSYML